MLRYAVNVWEGWLARHPDAKTLPVVIPIVVHHSDAGWTGAVRFEDLLDVTPSIRAALGPHLPRMQIILDDLSAQDDDALQARAMTALGKSGPRRSAPLTR